MMATLSTRELAFVQSARVGHLGTADSTGEPHVVPVCYAVLGETAYILIDRKPKRSGDPYKLKRVTNILANSSSCLTVDRYDEDWSRLAFVMMRGPAMLVDHGEEYDAAVRTLELRYPQYEEQQLGGRPVIAIRIQTVSSWGLLDA